MPGKNPTLVIYSPAPNAVVGSQPFNVTGLVTAPGMPEPVMINSVTVQVDAQPAVHAKLKHVPNQHLVEVTYAATVQITNGQDPHIVTVTVMSDAGVPINQSVSVDVGPRFVEPSLLIDLATIDKVDPKSDSVQKMASEISKRVASLPLINQLVNVNKIVVGPNIIAVTEPLPLLRIAFWIVDASFPPSELVPPSADFPLRRLTPIAAGGSFGLAAQLDVPSAGMYPPSPADLPLFGFALTVSTDSLQSVLNSYFSKIVEIAASHDFNVESATIRTDTSGSVITTVSGSLSIGPTSVGMTATLTETLGIAKRTGTEQSMPVVRSSSHNVSVGDAADWVLGALFPAVGVILLGAFGLVSYSVGQVSDKATGIISTYLDQLRARIPFRNSNLPTKLDLQSKYPFPMAVLNFESFTTDGSHIAASGNVGLGGRDQAMVAVLLHGPTYFPNYSFGIQSAYSIWLEHFEPDNDRMTWNLSGTVKSEPVRIDSFWQRGGFATDFPLPLTAAPGKYHYTIKINGTETCATDPTKKLTGSAFLTVTANVIKGSPLP